MDSVTGGLKDRGEDYLYFDEFAFFENIYKGLSLNEAFYDITAPFRMDSQFSSPKSGDNESRKSRKRARTWQVSEEQLEIITFLEDTLKTVVDAGLFPKKPEDRGDNNRRARHAASHVEKMPFTSLYKPTNSNTRLLYEVCLGDRISTVKHNPNEYTMWINTNAKVLEVTLGEQTYLMPGNSAFMIADVPSSTHVLATRRKKYKFIVMDPPWKNKSVKRKVVYETSSEENLHDLDIPELLADNGLLAIWVTNSPHMIDFANELIEYYGLEKLPTWRWLKITKHGEAVHGFKFHHKMPYENIVFACKGDCLKKYKEAMPAPYVIMSVPSSVHSRKVPLLPVLQEMDILEKSDRCLELYGRYLLPQTTTIGFESFKMQNTQFMVSNE